MNLEQAVKYPSKDWTRVFHLILSIIGMVTFPAFLGYNIAVIRKVAAGDEELLPDWDFGDYWINGFKATLGLIVYMIPLAIIGAIFSGSTNSQSVLPAIIGFIAGFPLMCLYFVALMRFSVEEQLGAFLDVETNYEILQKNFSEIAGTTLLVYVATIVVSIVAGFLTITICLGFVMLSYAYLVNSFLIGKLSRRLNISPPQEVVFQASAETQQVSSNNRPNHSKVEAEQESQPTTASDAIPAIISNLETATIYEIQVPKGEKLEPERAVTLIEQVVAGVMDLTFAIVAEPEKISWQIWDLRQELNPTVIKQSITDVYPKAQVTIKPFEQPAFAEPFWRSVLLYQQAVDFVAPIKYIAECTKLDPLATLVNGMGDLQEGEKITHFLHIPSALTDQARQDAFKRITRSTFTLQGNFTSWEGAGELVGSTFAQLLNQSREGKYAPKYQSVYEERLSSHLLLNCYLLTQIDVRNNERMSRFAGFFKSMIQFRGEENGIFYSEALTENDVHIQSAHQDKLASAVALLGKWMDGTDSRHNEARLVLSTHEVATLWHLPHQEFTTSEIDWQDIALPTKELVENQEGIIVGDSTVSGIKYPIRIHPKDRETHLYAIGKTGTGKSTFFHNSIHQDIQNGKGVGVLDPHGKLVRDILRLSIPDSRIDDVVVLDLKNIKHPPPLNPLQAPGRDDNYAASEVVAILETIEGSLPPRTANSLNAAFVTIRKEQTPTVRDAVKLFREPEYRYKIMAQVDDPITQDYWEDYEQLSPSRQDELKQPVMHRLGRFYRNPILYPIFCHPQPLNYQDLIRQKKIVLMSLGVEESLVPEIERRLVGVSLIKQFQMAAMASLEEKEFFLYIDEVQNFITAPLDVILEQARKFGLRLNFANQYLGQLGNILPSVMGNTGTTVVFQIGQDDARKLATYFEPKFERGSLENMDKYHAAIKTRFLGNSVSAFKIATRPEPKDLFDYHLESRAAKEREQMIRERSIQNYTPMSRTEVFAWLQNRYPRKVFASPNDADKGDMDWQVSEGEDA